MFNKRTQIDENADTTATNKKIDISRWVVGGIFIVLVLVNGFHFSSLFLILSAFLMFPFPFMKSFFKERNIKTAVVIAVAVAFFFVGILMMPTDKDSQADSNQGTLDAEGNENENSGNASKPSNSGTSQPSDSNTNKPIDSNTSQPSDSSTNKPIDSSTSQPSDSNTSKPSGSSTGSTNTTTPEQEMVWIASSGKKYHSKSSCSNMTSPKQISIEEAKKQGYEACKRCH